VLTGAPGLQDPSAPPLLRAQLIRARRDAAMVVGLEEIRLRSSERRRPRDSGSTIDQLYAGAFGEYGIPVTDLDPADAARRVRGSAIRETLIVFLHDWLYWAPDADREHVRAVVEQADSDPWRREVRQARADGNAERLTELAAAPEASAQPPVVLSGLTNDLLAAGRREAAHALLRDAQQRHPGDFWINYQLGEFLQQQQRPAEAAGYFRVAVAMRPQNDPAYTLLGRTLRDARDLDGAIAAFRRAVELNPDRGGTRDLAGALAQKGELEEARVSWAKVLARDPPDHEAWYGYAQLCLYLGNEEAYARTRKAMLARFGDTDNWIIAERTSLACMLRPASGEELRQVIRVTQRAARLGPKPPEPDNRYIQFIQGLSEYRQGHFKDAIPILRQAATQLPNRAGPRVALAMAQFRAGSEREARESLAQAVRTANWRESHGVHPTVWVNHVLRREAEALMLPNLPAFLRGEYQPSDNDERLAFLAACQFQERYAAAARLYAEAFAADPALAKDAVAECARRAATESQSNDRSEVLNTECRYLAARCAALAGCGKGRDAAKPDEVIERARWREQAREWLRADLAGWRKTLDDGDPASRDLVNRMLTGWQEEPDLAGVRDPDALKNLPAGERDEWNAFWEEVLLASRNTQ
jgi:tetratricopeptide (TPR) repeat protein